MIAFFDHPLFTITGALSTIISIATVIIFIVTVLFCCCCWVIGIAPIIFRIGIALWKRKIAVFSSHEQFDTIESMLLDSKIFSKKNIIHINEGNIEKSKKMTVFLVDWEECSEKIDEIFRCRQTDQTPVIIFAKPGSIEKDKMVDIANRINVIVVNFRGRLLNDILISMITSSYNFREK